MAEGPKIVAFCVLPATGLVPDADPVNASVTVVSGPTGVLFTAQGQGGRPLRDGFLTNVDSYSVFLPNEGEALMRLAQTSFGIFPEILPEPQNRRNAALALAEITRGCSLQQPPDVRQTMQGLARELDKQGKL